LHADGDQGAGVATLSVKGSPYFDNANQKFGNSSILFDALDDHITATDSANWDIPSGDWTVDFWVRHASLAANQGYIGQYQDDNNGWWITRNTGNGLTFNLVDNGSNEVSFVGGTISDNNWHHVALVKVSDEYAFYLDGTQTAYVSDSSLKDFSGDLYIGRERPNDDYMNGNIDEVRIQGNNVFGASPVVGLTDTITVPTSAGSSDANTRFLYGFEGDSSDTDNRVDFENTVDIAGGTTKWDGSYRLHGSTLGSYLRVPHSSDYNLSGDDFTFDFWVNFQVFDSSGFNNLVWKGTDSSISYQIDYKDQTDELRFVYYNPGANVITRSWNASTGSWHHIAVVREGSAIKLFVDGSQLGGDGSISGSVTDNTNDLYLGVRPVLLDRNLDAYIDEFRFSNTARWSNGFATPTAPYSEPSAGVVPEFSRYTWLMLVGVVFIFLFWQRRKVFGN